MRSTRSFLSLLVLAALAGCTSEPPKPASEPAPAAAPEQAAAPAGMGGMAAGHGAPEAAAGTASLTGTVQETMDSGGYTYMRLKTEAGADQWTAVNQTSVKKGQKVTVVNAMAMDGFESKTLKRTFDRIIFGQLQGDPGAAAGPGGASPAAVPAGGPGEPTADVRKQLAAQHAGLSQDPADVGDVKVPKAEGGDARTVAEVFAQKAQLDGKSVTIRGKVVKFTPGVMGRNWIHLRDGSGSPDKADHDVTVTTKDTAAKGDVIVVKGKVGVGRDFGMGYAYPVLIEEATIAR